MAISCIVSVIVIKCTECILSKYLALKYFFGIQNLLLTHKFEKKWKFSKTELVYKSNNRKEEVLGAYQCHEISICTAKKHKRQINSAFIPVLRLIVTAKISRNNNFHRMYTYTQI